MSAKSGNYFLLTLGCPKNEVDSEALEIDLVRAGFRKVEQPELADVLIVNSCGFINDSRIETLDAVFQIHKSRKKDSVLVLAGCLPARYDLKGILSEVDIFLPWNAHRMLLQSLRDKGLRPQVTDVGRRRLQPSLPYAYLKISEGCDNRCSYCAIPDIKGPFVSRPMDEIIEEADYLCSCGVRELILVGQDTTSYNAAGGRDDLGTLLGRLDRIAGCEWIRVMYAHPARLTDKILEAIGSCPKVVKYIDLPLQHINGRILKLMNRRIDKRGITTLIERLRDMIPGAVLRTTFIVGFPGETDEEFGELLDFCEMMEFDHVGAFRYSLEDGTPAAGLPGRVDGSVAEERYLTLLDQQNKISHGKLARRVGTIQRILVQEIAPGSLAVGRAWFQAPEVDGQVHVKDSRAGPGSFVNALINSVDAYDLFAQEVTAEKESMKLENKVRQ